MKTIIFLLLISMSTFAQRFVRSDTLDVSTIDSVSADTVIYKVFKSVNSGYGFGGYWSIEFDYTALDSSVVISVGGSNFGGTFNAYEAKTANPAAAVDVNGTSKATAIFYGDNHPMTYFAFKVARLAAQKYSANNYLIYKFVMQ